MIPGSKKQFWAIEYHTKSKAKRKEYAEDEGMSEESAEKVSKEVKSEE